MKYDEPIRRDRTMPRDGESDEHWHHRMRVENYYKILHGGGNDWWPGHWGHKPPGNRGFYQEPPDLGPQTNNGHRPVS